MRRITAAAVLTASLMGCAGTNETRPDPGVSERVRELEAERKAMEDKRREQAQRIRELETQLGLAQARVRELRDGRWDTVRIREQDGADDDGAGAPQDEPSEDAGWPRGEGGWNEPTSDADRPVLRLHGSSSASDADDDEPLPPVPTARPGFEQLPVAPLPDEQQLRAAMRAPADGPDAEGRAADAHGGRAAQDDGGGDAAVASYRAALAMVRDRRFGEALVALEQFVERHPDHAYVDNALYWRGEVFYAQRRYRDALGAFRMVAERHPSGNKISDALLKMALCHKRMGELRKARALFDRLRREHPDSLAARIASGEDNS